MRVTFEGHACFTLESAGTTVLIDPFISGNPSCTKQPEQFSPDLILITHGHGDHVGDAFDIARRCHATVAAQVDLLRAVDTSGIDAIAFNTGGTIDFDQLRITMTAAWHGSTISTPQGDRYAGVACGFVINDGQVSVYHAGDTALFGDMGAVIKRYNLTCALLPIGDFYTMGPKDALTAAHWLGAKYVVPMHYNTFPVIRQDAAAFAAAVEDKTESRCRVLQPGETLEL